jgi:flagellar L-ring protein FlgH
MEDGDWMERSRPPASYGSTELRRYMRQILWSIPLLLGLALPLAPPAAAQAEPAVTAERPVRQSWTADRRAFVEGDMITVLIDEHTLAMAHQGNSAVDARRRDMSADARADARLPDGSIGGLPVSGGAAVGTSNVGESRQRGDATRENRFRGEITVRVVSVDAGGNLRVEGRKMVNVDRNRQEISLTGFVRPQDVSPQNVIDSWRVADAEVVYVSRGSLDRPRGGILSRLLAALWP